MGLKVENVSKSFESKSVVNSISFEMNKPGVFGLLGTNGAGKTTTIRMILGILEKDLRKYFMGWKKCNKKKCQLWIFTRRKRNISKN